MPDAGQPKRAGCLALTFKLTIAGILFIAIAAGSVLIWSRGQASRILDEYKARQLPTSLQELNAWYAHVPDSDNAALGFLAAAGETQVAFTDIERSLPIVGSSDDREYGLELQPDELRTAKEYLEKNAKALELGRAAALLKTARYPTDLNLGVTTIDTKLFGELRNVARLFWLEGLVCAQAKNTAGAVDSYSNAYAVSRSLSPQPLLISQLVVVGIESQTAREISYALSIVPFSAADLDRLSEIVSQSPRISYLGRAIAGEGVFALFDDSPVNPLAWPTLVFDRPAYANNIVSLFDASSLELKEAVARIEGMGVPVVGPLDPWLHPMSSAVMPVFTRAFESAVRGEIYRDLLLIAFAVEKYRLESGGLPEDLKGVAPKYIPEVPLDPYGDGPYRYLRETIGFTVYSVGPDRVDGRGEQLKSARPSTMVKTPARPSGDIALRIAR